MEMLDEIVSASGAGFRGNSTLGSAVDGKPALKEP